MDKVFNVLEETPYYTIFQEVEIEDVDEEFLTAEEMKESGNDYNTSFSVGSYGDGKTGYINMTEIRKDATEASLLFKNRGKKGGKQLKTIAYPLDFEDKRVQEVIRNHFRDELKSRNLKYVGGRVRLETKEKTLFNKNRARKGMMYGLELLLFNEEKGFGVDVKMRESHVIKYQRRYCKFAEKLGITHQILMDYIDEKTGYYMEEARKEASHVYLKEFWDESLTFVEEVTED
jgi:hypothetical protein